MSDVTDRLREACQYYFVESWHFYESVDVSFGINEPPFSIHTTVVLNVQSE